VQSEINEQTKRMATFQQELEKLNSTLQQVETYNTSMTSEIAVTRRGTPPIPLCSSSSPPPATLHPLLSLLPPSIWKGLNILTFSWPATTFPSSLF
jgi:hypothetical protein